MQKSKVKLVTFTFNWQITFAIVIHIFRVYVILIQECLLLNFTKLSSGLFLFDNIVRSNAHLNKQIGRVNQFYTSKARIAW